MTGLFFGGFHEGMALAGLAIGYPISSGFIIVLSLVAVIILLLIGVKDDLPRESRDIARIMRNPIYYRKSE